MYCQVLPGLIMNNIELFGFNSTSVGNLFGVHFNEPVFFLPAKLLRSFSLASTSLKTHLELHLLFTRVFFISSDRINILCHQKKIHYYKTENSVIKFLNPASFPSIITVSCTLPFNSFHTYLFIELFLYSSNGFGGHNGDSTNLSDPTTTDSFRGFKYQEHELM